MLHSPGLLEFAAAAGLCQPPGCNPFNWFDAFMTNDPGDQVCWIGCAGNLLKAVSLRLWSGTKPVWNPAHAPLSFCPVCPAPSPACPQVYSTQRVRDLQRLLNGTRNRGVALGYEVNTSGGSGG